MGKGSSLWKRTISTALCLLLVAQAAMWHGVARAYGSQSIVDDPYRFNCSFIPADHCESFYSELSVLCEKSLWSGENAYNSCHFLMVPLHYAFYSRDVAAQSQFDKLFSRFTEAMAGSEKESFQSLADLDRLHFLYLASQYLCLCDAYGHSQEWMSDLAHECEDGAISFLYGSFSNWRTDQHPVANIRDIVAGEEYEYRYQSLITDDELFALAILCDIASLKSRQSEELTIQEASAIELVSKIFQSPDFNEETEGGGWLFQPGRWSDHPDYAYAGNSSIVEGMKESLIEDAAWDTSHFSRMPLFLLSYERAQQDEKKKSLFQKRRQQLANQMATYVLKRQRGYWVTTTFMDGINGVYRYSEDGGGAGIVGYELSGTFCFGWWVLLHDQRISQCYRDISVMLPLPNDETNPYYYSFATSEQTQLPDAFVNWYDTWYERIIECSAVIGSSDLDRYRSFNNGFRGI